MLLTVLAAVAAVAAILAAIGAWFIGPKSSESEELRPAIEEIKRSLAETERRLTETLAHQQRAFESLVRETTQQAAKSQTDLAVSLSKLIGDNGSGLMAKVSEQFQQLQQTQLQTMAAHRETLDSRLGRSEAALRELTLKLSETVSELRNSLLLASKTQSDQHAASAAELKDSLARQLAQSRQELALALEKLQKSTAEHLSGIRKDNEEKLEKMRLTVDEKLHATLETRLGESFKLVSERLELVHRGLGEMKTLAEGVGDLKRVLTNVRSRGTFGEVQLAALLEQVFTPSQYDTNVATKPNSADRVEFALRLPSHDEDDSIVYLPIDAKFPQEDYLRVSDAYEKGDAQALEEARKALRLRLMDEANTICQKYVAPPHTTDFAILFVPTEGLYAEALRMNGLIEEMQRKCRVVLVGPTTLFAILSSLQMGFRTLAIEKRSSEVWKVLGAVKTEFGKFGDSLDAVSKKLHEASNKIEDSARRSRAVMRKLKSVEELPETEAEALLSAPAEADSLE